ncbi:MAG TPA: hypothetical protein VJN89_06250 [Candidatus Acidoferrum sp.]|nr:hypothetical protein [Candidatus Acidoferrum sp.]
MQKGETLETVFLLWHVHKFRDSKDTDEKLIGVYKTEEDARAAITRLANKPGFHEAPAGFQISQYELNKDHWTEGYKVLA